MRKEVVAFISVLTLTVLSAQYLPDYMDLPAGVVQEKMMLVLLPVLLVFIWWIW